MKICKLFLSFALVSFISFSAFAGGISGKVLSKNKSEPLSYVTVKVQDRPMGTLTHADGSFSLNGLQPGCYNLTIEQNGYEATEICGLTVEEGGGTTIEVDLKEDAREMEGFSIRSLDGGSDSHTLETVTIYANPGSGISSWAKQKMDLALWVGEFMSWARSLATVR